MGRAAASSWLATAIILAACGGKGVSSGDSDGGSSSEPTPNGAGSLSSGGHGSGASAAGPGAGGTAGSTAGAQASSGAGSSAGGTPGSTSGICLAACVPTALFAVSGVPEEYLTTRIFAACKNADCYSGGPFETLGTTLSLKNLGTPAQESKVRLTYEEANARLLFSWTLGVDRKDFMDGDHYTLDALTPSESQSLVDRTVTYEHYDLCGSPCTRANLIETLSIGNGGASSD